MLGKNNSDLISYYRDRSYEYDKIYLKPKRQKDLHCATLLTKELFSNKAVLEIICETEYWTEKIAERADSFCAFDINISVIEIVVSPGPQYPPLQIPRSPDHPRRISLIAYSKT